MRCFWKVKIGKLENFRVANNGLDLQRRGIGLGKWWSGVKDSLNEAKRRREHGKEPIGEEEEEDLDLMGFEDDVSGLEDEQIHLDMAKQMQSGEEAFREKCHEASQLIHDGQMEKAEEMFEDLAKESIWAQVYFGWTLIEVGSIQRGMEKLEEAVDQGCYEACDMVGHVYLNGRMGFSANLEKAVSFLKLGHSKGIMGCSRSLASVYLNDDYPYGSVEEARSILQRLIQKGFTEAEGPLSVLLFHQAESDPSTLPQAKRLLEESVERGEPKAIWHLADLYYRGKYYRQDYEEAFELLQLIKGTVPRAQTRIGLMHFHGHHVPENRALGVRIIEKQAEKGESLACLYMGIFCNQGWEVPQSVFKAIEYWKSSQEVRALNYLGMLYLNGKPGLGKNYKAAREYFNLAIGRQFKPAYVNLSRMYRQGLGVKKDVKLGLDYLEKALSANEPRAFTVLGELYEYGFSGIKKDPKAAADMYFHASRLGDKKGALNYARFLYLGAGGLDKNQYEALNIFNDFPERKESLYFRGKDMITKKNYTEGIKLIEQADGYHRANTVLGYGYYYGKYGLEKDIEKAVYHFKRTNFHGMYPIGVPAIMSKLFKDPLERNMWLRKASYQGHAKSSFYLGWDDLNQGHVGRAYHYFKKASDGQFHKSRTMVSYMKIHGWGCREDPSHIMELEQRAHRDKTAAKHMAYLLLKGNVMDQDIERAYDYLAMSGYDSEAYLLRALIHFQEKQFQCPYQSYAFFRELQRLDTWNDIGITEHLVSSHMQHIEEWAMKSNNLKRLQIIGRRDNFGKRLSMAKDFAKKSDLSEFQPIPSVTLKEVCQEMDQSTVVWQRHPELRPEPTQKEIEVQRIKRKKEEEQKILNKYKEEHEEYKKKKQMKLMESIEL